MHIAVPGTRARLLNRRARAVLASGRRTVRSAHAELLRLGRWWTVWLLFSAWLVVTTCFGDLLPYLAFREAASGDGARHAAMLWGLLPQSSPESLVAGLPMFAGAIVLVLGALATGSGYGWDAWKTVLSQGPRRLEAFSGTVLVLVGLVVLLVLATLAVKVGAGLVVADLAGRAVRWPSAGDVVRSVGAGALILGMFASGGAFLGVALRRAATAVGLGLVWVFGVENLVRGVAGDLDPLHSVSQMLPGTAAGSLAGALGAARAGVDANAAGSPGVFTALDGETASVVLACYLVTFLVLLMLLVNRRDV